MLAFLPQDSCRSTADTSDRKEGRGGLLCRCIGMKSSGVYTYILQRGIDHDQLMPSMIAAPTNMAPNCMMVFLISSDLFLPVSSNSGMTATVPT
jgi:hypothetical protein